MKEKEIRSYLLIIVASFLWVTTKGHIFLSYKILNGLEIGPAYSILENSTENSAKEFRASYDESQMQKNDMPVRDGTVTKLSTQVLKEQIIDETARTKVENQTKAKTESSTDIIKDRKTTLNEDGSKLGPKKTNTDGNASLNRLNVHKLDDSKEIKDAKKKGDDKEIKDSKKKADDKELRKYDAQISINQAPTGEDSDFKSIAEANVFDQTELTNDENGWNDYSDEYLKEISMTSDEVPFNASFVILPAIIIDESSVDNETNKINVKDGFIYEISTRDPSLELASHNDQLKSLEQDSPQSSGASFTLNQTTAPLPFRESFSNSKLRMRRAHNRSHRRGCSYPEGLMHSKVTCFESRQKIVCHQKCVFGYTLKRGKQRRQICHQRKGYWRPSREFSDCKPFVDCTVGLKPGGHKLCTFNHMRHGPVCKLSCDAYGHKKAVRKRKHTCNIRGQWRPRLPHCAHRGTGQKLVPGPHRHHYRKRRSHGQQLESQNEEYEGENDEHKEQSDEYEWENDEHKEQNDEYEGENDEHKEQNDEYEWENDEHKEQNDEYEEENDEHKEQNDEYEEENDEHKEQNDEYEGENDEHKQQNDEYETENDEHENQEYRRKNFESEVAEYVEESEDDDEIMSY